MLTGHESLQMYRKGIEVLKTDYESYSRGQKGDDATLAKKQIATAYASIGELFMTHLW